MPKATVAAATETALAEAEVETKAPVKKSQVTYWKNNRYSALTILVRGGEDYNGHLGIKHEERFVPYYDTWKGDVIRVGYLQTENKDVAERCTEDPTCIEITESEYNKAVEELRVAPIAQV